MHKALCLETIQVDPTQKPRLSFEKQENLEFFYGPPHIMDRFLKNHGLHRSISMYIILVP